MVVVPVTSGGGGAGAGSDSGGGPGAVANRRTSIQICRVLHAAWNETEAGHAVTRRYRAEQDNENEDEDDEEDDFD